MTPLAWIILFLCGAVVALEIGARIRYRMRFRLPFRAKIVGEYPFRSFLLEAEPPLCFRFKKGFRSSMVNINRFGLRGPEPAADGVKKRLLVIGESNIFGVKLLREDHLWSIKLEKILAGAGKDRWEVLNGGNPGYNTFQHLAFWREELHRTKPDILLISFGINDLTQAWVMGSQWKPGAPWPFGFVLALERRSPWWNKAVGYSCLYFLLRRAFGGGPRRGFKPHDDKFQKDACLEGILGNYRALVEDARQSGIEVACTAPAMAYDRVDGDDDERRLDSIQSNWREFAEFQRPFERELKDAIEKEFCPETGIPYFDISAWFLKHPRRLECYFDLAHVNERGMALYAEGFYNEIDRLGWWDL
jgi:lysophospholipase L1-like esterase